MKAIATRAMVRLVATFAVALVGVLVFAAVASATRGA
jgi:hypothetical protein